MKTAKQLREERAKIAAEIKRLADLINKENRAFSAAEDENWKKVNADYDALTRQIEIADRNEAVARDQQSTADAETRDGAGGGGGNGGRLPGRDDSNSESRERDGNQTQITEEHRSLALQAWCLSQFEEDISERQQAACDLLHFNPNRRQLRFDLPSTQARRAIQRQFRSVAHDRSIDHVMQQRTAMSAQLGASGGFTIGETFLRTLEVNMLAFGGMRQVAEIMNTPTGERMSWPTADDTSNTGEQIGENATVDNSNAGGPLPSFGQIFWDAYKFSSKTVLVPFELLQDSMVNLPEVLGQMLGERIGRITNTKYTTGGGNSGPKGLITAAATGVTAASATAITFDEVIRLEHSVDPAYRIGAGYMFHDSIALALRLLKDGQGRPLWQDNPNSGMPQTLNGRPIANNQDMASAVSTGAKTIAFGQLNKYKIRSVGSARLYRLQERYRDKDQDGFILLVREDGNLLNAGTNPVKLLVQA